MTTPTPRTDGALFLVARLEGEPIYMVSPEHARQLERELAEAKRERDDWKKEHDKMQSKVVTCGVIASHENFSRLLREPYSGKWASQQSEKVLQLRINRDAWRECANRLADSLSRTNLDCHELSHRKGEFHEGFDCPVVNKIEKTIAAYEKLKEASK